MYLTVKNYELNHDGHFERHPDGSGKLYRYRSILTGALYELDDVDTHSLDVAVVQAELNPLFRVWMPFTVIKHSISADVHYNGDEFTIEDVVLDNVEIDPTDSELYELLCDVLCEEYLEANPYP